METHGRAAWPNSGAGGTKAYNDPSKPGPYYFIGSGELNPDSSQDAFAVRQAVKAYQRAINRRLGDKWTLVVSGRYDAQMAEAVKHFQSKRTDLIDWGGIGPDTSKALLMPDLINTVSKESKSSVPATVVSGLIRHESGWDAGAVGYIDPEDLGLAQINGPSHPNLTAVERLRPLTAFEFVINYMDNAMVHFGNNLRDSIASYNLGIGGADRWISQGRPQMYTPVGSNVSRDVWAYIDSVLEG